MLSKKKKIFILSGMLVLLVATAVVNVILNNSLAPVDGKQTEVNFFADFRAERAAGRAETILYYQAIIDSPTSTEAERASAVASRDALTDLGLKETNIEWLVKSMGFDDCVVTLGANVNVIVKTAVQLEEGEVARILSDTMRESGMPATSIRVIPIV